MLAIGLMSGTSLDGVDACLVRIENNQYKLEKFITLPYDEDFKEKIARNLNNDTAKLQEICSLNFELGYWFVKAIDILLENTSYQYNDIDFVASHGQTIWHNPRPINGLIPSTLQIGEPSVIAYHTGIKTIANFRAMDIVAGGEGAPLVPFSEYLIFKNNHKNRILQNIGGIGNLTYLKKGCQLDEIIAFDTGPGNVMIDYFIKKYFNLPYDKDGNIAFKGHVIEEVINYLMQDKFIYHKPPKSTGREQYSVNFMENLACKLNFSKYPKEDIITTITEFTVRSIVYNYRAFIKNYDEVIVSGGGSHNQYILSRLKHFLNCSVFTQNELGYNSDAKEAIAFVVLGHMTLQNKPSNVPSATGAKDHVILGNITYNPRKKG
ncbi:MAG: anhydro-N-acetylmuramic acid kinase [Acholeplasmataceae bacterium]|nr:anhydro-N-acetylmuramic acid kinase [Acholeplasmataceae bacterium]